MKQLVSLLLLITLATLLVADENAIDAIEKYGGKVYRVDNWTGN